MTKRITRCSICNCVSSEEIETNIGDYHPGNLFVPDPKNSLFDICLPCSETAQEVLSEYDFMEETELTNEDAFDYWDNEEDTSNVAV